jgi:hypothetical protein
MRPIWTVLIIGCEIEFGDEIEGRTPSMDKNLAFT